LLAYPDIIEALTGFRPPSTTPLITDAVVDSRIALPGAFFIALPGEHADGHDFLEDAIKRGAVIALIEKEIQTVLPILDLRGQIDSSRLALFPTAKPFCILVMNCLKALHQIARFWRSKLNLRVIGITGSVGKSTTKEVTAEVLTRRYRTLRNPGNMNNEIGLPLTILRLNHHHQCAVLEMGFYVEGEIAELCDIAHPQVGVVTNIGTVHASRAGSREAIARGKSELIQALPPAPEGTAILNQDDPWVREMASKTRANVFTYGFDPSADIWADEVESLGLEGIIIRIHFKNEDFHVRVPLIGRHSAHTVLRAAAVGLVENLSWHEIIAGLQTTTNQLRLVVVKSQNGALILDDTYNASPESTLAALNLLNELEGRKIAVLGDMLELGPYERRGHALVGLRAAEVVDELVTLGERGKQIATAAILGGLKPSVIKSFDENDEIVAYLEKRLSALDVVLIKGSRGMQMDRIVNSLEDPS
jgi:UDP-N-acetylmuramoyl-tripeptide--D-alanyl-D-alanine ligase